MKTITEYLSIVDDVIAKGKFKDDWQSLSKFEMPKWYGDGRFGIFIHWGCYSVPAVENEWFPRQMYIKLTKSWNYKVQHYGVNADYRQIVQEFNPQKFDAEQWIQLFKESGAKYIMPVAEHHDGIKMYESELNKWNMKELVGRDFSLELKKAAESNGLGFCASNHRAEHYWFLNGARKNCPNSEVAKNLYPELYGPAKLSDDGKVWVGRKLKVTKDWLEDWLASACEMVDKLQPLAVYFDWWIYMADFKPYLKKFLAYYYNRGIEWGKQVGVFYKWGSVMKGCGIFDVERGQIDGISGVLWQNDTAIAKNSWGYTENNKFKTTSEILKNMIDVVSKNGCFMLNVGPKADGTICDEEAKVLKEVGVWMKSNGEAIYGSKPYDVFGEGKKTSGGTFKENNKYAKGDYRFTYKTNAIYVFAMADKPQLEYVVKSLRNADEHGIRYTIKGVTLLGHNEDVTFEQSERSLKLCLKNAVDTTLPLCFKVEID